jgi:hypothetical protein
MVLLLVLLLLLLVLLLLLLPLPPSPLQLHRRRDWGDNRLQSEIWHQCQWLRQPAGRRPRQQGDGP